MNPAIVVVSAFQEFIFQFLAFVPKLFVALVIWVIGKPFIRLGIDALRKVEFKGAKPVNKFVDTLAFVLMPVGKLLLFLIILDYLGIGRTVISAVLSGLTFAVAIALGLSFGKAFEHDAKEMYESVKKQLNK